MMKKRQETYTITHTIQFGECEDFEPVCQIYTITKTTKNDIITISLKQDPIAS